MNADAIIQAYVDDVARFLPRRIRNDVGFELKSLLIDQLNARAADAGVKPDAGAALEVLQGFGRPEEVAERYRPSGFVVVEPSAASGFVKIAVIGVLLQWIVTASMRWP